MRCNNEQAFSMADIQNYNNGDLPSNGHITYQDTNGLKDNDIHLQQQDSFCTSAK